MTWICHYLCNFPIKTVYIECISKKRGIIMKEYKLKNYLSFFIKYTKMSKFYKHPPPHWQSSVHGRSAFLHRQRPAHRFLQPHFINSRHSFEASRSVIHNGWYFPSFNTHPQFSGLCSGCCFTSELFHMLKSI